MNFSRCVICTKNISNLVIRRYSNAGRLQRRTQVERYLTGYNSTLPVFTVKLHFRYLSTDHNKPSVAGSELPIPLVRSRQDIDFTKSVDIPDPRIKSVNELKSVNDKTGVKLESKSKHEGVQNKPPASDAMRMKGNTNDVISTVPRPSLGRRVWAACKNTAVHYYDGSRLLVIEVKISSRLFRKILNGTRLTRREKRQLTRTLADLFRLVPLVVFLMIPFLELLLPLALILFPNLLPSTFETIDKKKEKKLKTLKLKLDMAKFLQESLVENNILLQNAKPKEVARFSAFIAKVKSPDYDPIDDVEELVSFSKLFSDHMTLDNFPINYLVALCKLLNIPTFGTDNLLRSRLRSRLATLKEDDLLIQAEGLANLTPLELQKANSDRGMRSVGVSIERLALQMEHWLELHLKQEVPATLLLLSRALYLPSGPVPSYDDLMAAVAHLPDNLIGEAKLKIAAEKGEQIGNRDRLEAVKSEEMFIAKEEEQQHKKEAQRAEAQRIKEEQAIKEESNTRVGAHILMYQNESLKDLAKPILTEDEIEIEKEEVAEIQQLISSLRDRKNPLTEEKEELQDLLDKILDHESEIKHMSESGDGMKPSRRNRMLSGKVVNMLTKSNKVLVNLENSLLKEEVLDIHQDDEVVLTRQEIKSAVQHLLSVDKKDKIIEILSSLSDPKDGSIKTSAVMKILEKIANEDTDLTKKEISAILKIAEIEKLADQKDGKGNAKS